MYLPSSASTGASSTPAASIAARKDTPLKDRAIYEQMVYTGLDPNGRIPLDSLEKDQEYFVGTGQQQQRINLGEVVDMSYAADAVRILGPYT